MSKEPVGTVAEEAAKLFAVLQQAARQQDPAPPRGNPKRTSQLRPNPKYRMSRSTVRRAVVRLSASGVPSAS